MAVVTNANSTGIVWNGTSVIFVSPIVLPSGAIFNHRRITPESYTTVAATINNNLDIRFDDPTYYG